MLRAEIMHPDKEIVNCVWAILEWGNVRHWCIVGSEDTVLTSCGYTASKHVWFNPPDTKPVCKKCQRCINATQPH